MTRPLRILHLLNASDAGGLSRYVHDLALATRERGHEVAVAGDRGAAHALFESASRQAGLEWLDLPLNSGAWGTAQATAMLRDWLRERRGVDLIHTHYRKPTLLAKLFLQSRKKPPVLYTLHLSGLPQGRLTRRLPLSLKWGDHTHVGSSEAAEWLTSERGVPAERITLVPHGVKVEKWPVTTAEARAAARAALGLSATDRVAAYVGRLDQDHPKNAHWALEVARQNPTLKLLLAGDGPDRPRLQGMIRDWNLANRVHLLGERNPLPVYQAADLLLLPSGREGFSLVTAEAMSTGLPVLRTQTPGTKELIVEGLTGATVPIDETAFVTAATELLAAAETLPAMRAPAAARIREAFTFDRQVAGMMSLYEQLAA